MNIIGIIVVTISINTFGMAYFGLNEFPTWAASGAAQGKCGGGAILPTNATILPTNATILPTNATILPTNATLLTTLASNFTTIASNITR